MSAEPQHNRLPFWWTVREAYVLTFRHLGDVLRIAWIWLIVLTVLVALTSAFFWPSHAAALDAGEPTSWVQRLTTTLSMAAGASIAVAWHRMLLAAEMPTGRYLRFDNVVWRYFLVGVAMMAPFILIDLVMPPPGGDDEDAAMTVAAAARQAVPLGFAGLAAFVAIKLSLVLPAIALAQQPGITIRSAWNAARGNWWRLFLGYVLMALPPLLVVSVPAALKLWRSAEETEGETQLGFVLANTLWELTALVAGIFAVSFLSLAFRHFFPKVGTGAASDGTGESG